MKRQVSLNNNSFDRAGITKDCKDGVCEYIWNGFEAGASKVSVALQGTPLQEAIDGSYIEPRITTNDIR